MLAPAHTDDATRALLSTLRSPRQRLLEAAPLLVAVLLPVALLLLISSSCTKGPDPRGRERAPSPLLTSMGFALTDDGDPATSSGTLAATFQAPVIPLDGVGPALGSAHVEFDDDARDLQAGTVLDAYPDLDLVYTVLFDEDEPWRYVVIAAHGADIVAGASLPLDGESASAIVVDELTGSGYVTDGGTLEVAVADGTTVDGALAGATLVEVGIASWPETLFPLTPDGAAAEHVAFSAAGSFDAPRSTDGSALGTADVTASAGALSLHATQSSTFALDDATTAIVLEDAADPSRVLVLVAPSAELVAGAHVALDGFAAGAWLLADDGTQVVATAGALDVERADDASIAGTVSIDADGLVYIDDFGEEPPPADDCTGIDTLAETFAPGYAYVDSAYGPGELPDGFSSTLTLADERTAILGIVVPTGADFDAGVDFAFDVVTFEGESWPNAMLVQVTCNQPVVIDRGHLTARRDAPGHLTGTLHYEAGAVVRDIALDLVEDIGQ